MAKNLVNNIKIRKISNTITAYSFETPSNSRISWQYANNSIQEQKVVVVFFGRGEDKVVVDVIPEKLFHNRLKVF